MKILSLFFALILLLGCFAGCQETPATPLLIEDKDGTLYGWKEKEIEDAYRNRGLAYTWSENSPEWIRYYGTENGYVILFEKFAIHEGWTLTIADNSFYSSEGFFLFAYKDGVFTKLEDAYAQGLISKSAIDTAWKIHQEYESAN